MPKFIFILILTFAKVSFITANNPTDFLDEAITPSFSSENQNFHKYCMIEDSNGKLPKCSFSSDPIASLEKARHVQANAEGKFGEVPPWLNLTLARQGQLFAKEYYVAIMIFHLYGLYCFYDDETNMLIFSRGSISPDRALYRYMATVIQITIWYDDLLSPNSDLKDSAFVKSITEVLGIHRSWQSLAEEKYSKDKCLVEPSDQLNITLKTVLKKEFFEDLEASNIPKAQRLPPPTTKDDRQKVPFNQQTASLTMFAFVGNIVLFPERLGIDAPLENIWAFNHLWAWIGYLLGIEDEYNIALQRDMESQRALYKILWERYVIPNFFTMNHQSKIILDIAAQGAEGIHGVSANVLFYLLLTRVLQIKAPSTYAALSNEEKLLVSDGFDKKIPLFKLDPVFRATMNLYLKNKIAAAALGVFGDKCISTKISAQSCYFRPPYDVNDSWDATLKKVFKKTTA